MRKLDWLASYPKSGNTYVRCLVAAYFGATNFNHFPDVATQSDLKTVLFHRHSPISLEKLTPLEAFGLRGAVLENMRAAPWGLVKTHHANLEVEDIHLFPDRVTNKAIYLVRDPRDVAASFAAHLSSDLQSVITLMNRPLACICKMDQPAIVHVLSTWSKHVDSWMRSRFPVHCVKYETLVRNPEDQLTKMLEFLDIEPDEERVRFAVESSRIDRLKDLEVKEGFREAKECKFFGGERPKLTEEQRQQIEHDHEDVMRALGYIE